MEKIVKQICRKFGIEIGRYSPEVYETKVISLKPENKVQGNVLLSYIIKPFVSKDGEPRISHTIFWECSQIAKTFLDLGYSVDVINFQNKDYIPKKSYSFFIDLSKNLERIAPLLNKDCIKIFHPIWAHWLFNNYSSYKRNFELQQRRGVIIRGQRLLDLNLAIEYADYATIKGNGFTLSTYRYANKPLYRVPQTTPILFPWPKEKNFDACRKNFLWLGGGGLVHKGLDLVLEAFVEMPDYHLYVCGPIQEEKDFENVYFKELYQTPNIHPIGWVDVESQKFYEVANNCVGLVYPSCSEGQSGSAVICLHAGLIPIISYETGVDVDNSFGIILKDCSVNEIKASLQMISTLPAEKLRQMSQNAWEFSRANHTKEKFVEEYKKIIMNIIEIHRNKQ